jgi:hypothetical protein
VARLLEQRTKPIELIRGGSTQDELERDLEDLGQAATFEMMPRAASLPTVVHRIVDAAFRGGWIVELVERLRPRIAPLRDFEIVQPRLPAARDLADLVEHVVSLDELSAWAAMVDADLHRSIDWDRVPPGACSGTSLPGYG